MPKYLFAPKSVKISIICWGEGGAGQEMGIDLNQHILNT